MNDRPWVVIATHQTSIGLGILTVKLALHQCDALAELNRQVSVLLQAPGKWEIDRGELWVRMELAGSNDLYRVYIERADWLVDPQIFSNPHDGGM